MSKENKNQKQVDERFSRVFNDPKFKEIPKKIKKVEINDERFQKMFTDKSFNDKLDFDEYGRLIKNKKKTNDLEKYYYGEKFDSKDNSQKKDLKKIKSDQKPKKKEKEEENNLDLNEDEQTEEKDNGLSKINDEKEPVSLEEEEKEILDVEQEEFEDGDIEDNTARLGLAGSDDDEDTDQEFEEFLQEYTNPENEDPFEFIEDKNIPTGEETPRLSIMNVDWESVAAKDLYVLFNSFISGNEKILKVEIYPSEYGIKEMEKQKTQGPNELFSGSDSDAENNKKYKKRDQKTERITDMDEALEDDDGSDYAIDQKKLRKFELKKLKFYYAIATFDSKETAFKVYSQCDGMELEKTQNFLDLRFVPDSLTEFPHSPKETFTGNKSLINYEPDFNQNRALQHSKVKLTWDTNDKKRDKMIQRAFTKEGFNRDDINELLVSSDSEEDEDLVGFKQMLLQNAEKDQENDMQLLKRKKNKEFKIKEGETFEVNFNKGFEGVNVSDKVLNSTKNDRSLYNEYLERKKNIRREKKIEERKSKEIKKSKRNGTFDDENEDGNYNRFEDKNKNENKTNKYEKSSKKELSLLVDESLKDKKFKFNANDDRFKAVGRDSKYAVDPTSKEFKNVKNSKKY